MKIVFIHIIIEILLCDRHFWRSLSFAKKLGEGELSHRRAEDVMADRSVIESSTVCAGELSSEVLIPLDVSI